MLLPPRGDPGSVIVPPLGVSDGEGVGQRLGGCRIFGGAEFWGAVVPCGGGVAASLRDLQHFEG